MGGNSDRNPGHKWTRLSIGEEAASVSAEGEATSKPFREGSASKEGEVHHDQTALDRCRWDQLDVDATSEGKNNAPRRNWKVSSMNRPG
jgi:hypothetical protein